MNNSEYILQKFFSIIASVALIISFIGVVIFVKTIFFCIKRYVYSCFNKNTELSTLVFPNESEDKPLSPSEIVRKTTLKEKIDKFARETSNIVKGNSYLEERKEDAVDKSYKKEMETLKNVYVTLDKIPINTTEELLEVEFLFNNGKLRPDEEIIEFYKQKEINFKKTKYRKTQFIRDILQKYKELEITSKLFSSISMILLCGIIFFYKMKIKGFCKWGYDDVFGFIIEVFKIAFSPYCKEVVDSCYYARDAEIFGFCIGLIFSSIISFFVGGGLLLISSWAGEIDLYKTYSNAGEKKKPDIMLGVNTASYLYVLHKLLKKRK